MASSGKTTAVDTLHRLSQEQEVEIVAEGTLTKIDKADGATLYFDRGIFLQKKNERKLYYHVYTVAGQTQYSPLRTKVFSGTDGVIFVVDSQTHLFEDNIDSLKELKKVSKGALIKELPLLIMLNKQDLTEVISASDFQQILKDEGLWYEPPHKLAFWNPIIYETCALYNKKKDVYNCFAECARRTLMYHVLGNGSAPDVD